MLDPAYVVCPTFTFAATAFPIIYQHARPLFVDCDPATWQIEPNLVEQALLSIAGQGNRVAAVIAADFYGQCADYDRLEAICARCEGDQRFDRGALLGDVSGVEFMPEAGYGRSSRWLSCITIARGGLGTTSAEVQAALSVAGVESRLLWTPLRDQPPFAGAEVVGGSESELLASTGLCLPSGSGPELG